MLVQPPPKLVLVVEDDPLILLLVAGALREAGFVVIESESAWQAMRVLEYLSASVDILLTDVQLPDGVSGGHLSRHVQDACPWIAMLLISAQAAPSAADMPPLSRFLAKPYQLSELVAEVRHLAKDIPGR